jgi:hypothetical protein
MERLLQVTSTKDPSRDRGRVDKTCINVNSQQKVLILCIGMEYRFFGFKPKNTNIVKIGVKPRKNHKLGKFPGERGIKKRD